MPEVSETKHAVESAMAESKASTRADNPPAESGSELDLDRILQILPHRPPFLFVERLLNVVLGEIFSRLSARVAAFDSK